MRTRFLVYAFSALAISIGAFAQPGHPGGGPGAGTTNPGGFGGSRTSQPGTFPGTDSNSSPDLTQNSVFLSGKVSMEDGTPPPDFVVLQLFCGTLPRSLGYTDAKGHFSVNLADRTNSASVIDVEDENPIGRGPGGGSNDLNMTGFGRRFGTQGLNGCELRANLAGFRSDSVSLFDRKAIDNPDLGTIFFHRRGNVEGLTISATTALAPGSARKAYDKGRESERKGKWEDAQRQFQKAVGEYPKFATAWYELGRTQEQLKDIEGARKSYAQALAADPKLVTPYEKLAAIAANEKNWQAVVDNTAHLLRLNPIDFPRAWYSNAYANFQLQNMEAAEKSARGGIAADSQHHLPKINYLLAMILEQKQDYAGAAENLHAYLALAPKASDADKVKQQLAEVEAKK